MASSNTLVAIGLRRNGVLSFRRPITLPLTRSQCHQPSHGKIPFGSRGRGLYCGTRTSPAVLASNLHVYEGVLFSKPEFNNILTVPDDENDGVSKILSISPAALEKDPTLIRRIIQWIQRMFAKCQNAVMITLRGTEIALRMSPLLVLTPASVIAAQFYGPASSQCEEDFEAKLHYRNNVDDEYMKTNNFIADLTWAYFMNAVTALGPAFVKLCQWVATRRDIFPPHICDRLAHLHDRGTKHDWSHTHNALVEAFGENYEELGLHVEHDKRNKNVGVIGCGSAAQVYKGTLDVKNKNTGETEKHSVAIKVLHPRFEDLVERDLWFMQSIAEILHSLPSDRIRMLNVPRATQNFGSILQLQADLRCEANNLKDFCSNFYKVKDKKESAVLFPNPVEGWISRDVLVEELVENSAPISEYLKDDTEEGHIIRRELAIPLLNAFLKMVFLDNFVHCDLHPGNVLVQTSRIQRKATKSIFDFTKTKSSDDSHGETEIKRQIVFLDAGIAFQLSKQDQQNLKDLFRAVVTNNGKEAGRLMVERARYERCSQVPGGVEAFSNGIGEIVSEFHDRRKDGLTLGAVRIGSLLTRVLDLCRSHGVEIDPAMASVIISTLVLEGLGRSLEPSLNLIDFALPFIMGRGRV